MILFYLRVTICSVYLEEGLLTSWGYLARPAAPLAPSFYSQFTFWTVLGWCLWCFALFFLFISSPACNALKLPCPQQAAVVCLPSRSVICAVWDATRDMYMQWCAAVMNAEESWCWRHGSNENLGDAIRNHHLLLTEATDVKNSN